MDLAAAVIAGGKSTRMGREKALLPACGHEHLLARQVDTLKLIKPSELLLSCRKGQFQFELAGVKKVYDDGQRGPLGGLAALLRSSRSKLVFVLAVDLPRISGTLIRKLAAEASHRNGAGLVPRAGDEIETLAAIYPTSMLGLVEDRLRESADHSMKGLVKEASKQGLVNWYEIQEHERPEFSNWNHPQPE